MERKNNLLIGLLAMAITYSSLMFFIGPRHYFRNGGHDHRQYRWHQHHDCKREGGAIWDKHRKGNRQWAIGRNELRITNFSNDE